MVPDQFLRITGSDSTGKTSAADIQTTRSDPGPAVVIILEQLIVL